MFSGGMSGLWNRGHNYGLEKVYPKFRHIPTNQYRVVPPPSKRLDRKLQVIKKEKSPDKTRVQNKFHISKKFMFAFSFRIFTHWSVKEWGLPKCLCVSIVISIYSEITMKLKYEEEKKINANSQLFQIFFEPWSLIPNFYLRYVPCSSLFLVLCMFPGHGMQHAYPISFLWLPVSVARRA